MSPSTIPPTLNKHSRNVGKGPAGTYRNWGLNRVDCRSNEPDVKDNVNNLGLKRIRLPILAHANSEILAANRSMSEMTAALTSARVSQIDKTESLISQRRHSHAGEAISAYSTGQKRRNDAN
jgi:hypothetical protein